MLSRIKDDINTYKCSASSSLFPGIVNINGYVRTRFHCVVRRKYGVPKLRIIPSLINKPNYS